MTNSISSYKVGDEFNIKVKVDQNIIIDQTLIITYAFSNIIITCGHCLPSNSEIPNGKIMYTSGYQTPSESEEIGFIMLKSDIDIKPEYYLLKKQQLLDLLSLYNLTNQINFALINRLETYQINPIKFFNQTEFQNLKLNQTNKTNEFFWTHAISKIITESGKLFDLFDMSMIGIAYSEAKCQILKSKRIRLMEKEFGYKILTNIFYSLTEPSYSGSPIVCLNNKSIIGYHLGSTTAYKLNNKNQIIWLGKIMYFKTFCLL